MRHRKNTFKVGRTSSHKRGMLANMLKNLIENERMITTVTKAKELRKYADRMITIAKDNNLAARRRAISKLEIRYNTLSSKDMRAVRGGKEQSYNMDRRVIGKLFDVLGPRFANRQGGYTRLIKSANRRGDNCQTCVIEYLSE